MSMTGGRHRPLIAATVAAIVAVSYLVVQMSSAAFVATTQNAGNNWQTGAVALTNDAPANTAMFAATGLLPGQQVEQCIVVTYDGDVDADVRLYGASLTQTNNLASDLLVTVDAKAGANGSFGNCGDMSGATTLVSEQTLAAFAAARTSFSNGLDSWAPTGTGQSRTYRVRVKLDDASTKSDSQASYSFVWEARNQPPD